MFDKKLRLLVLDALESIEIAVRVDTVHTLSRIDPLAYQNPDNFRDGFSVDVQTNAKLTKHKEWLTHQQKLIGRSDEELIKHNRGKYGWLLPIWMTCEAWDFGCLSKLFSGMKPEHQNAIARKYKLSDGRVFASWLRSLNYLRNVCAHHSRLWNRNIIVQPKALTQGEFDWYESFRNNSYLRARPFLLFCIIRHLLRQIRSNPGWRQHFKEVLDNFPNLTHLGLNLNGMGVPDGWQDWLLWQEDGE